jgi:hypothetical protein
MIEFYHLPEERKKEVIQKVSSFLEEKKRNFLCLYFWLISGRESNYLSGY